MRTIYLWDLHWTAYLSDFVKKYDDWKTKFVSLGDIFDRGPNSYENYQLIKKLYSEWKYDMVLWNHDLLFIFWIWLSEEYNGFLLPKLKEHKKYKDFILLWKDALLLLKYNWGEETLNSIFKRYEDVWCSNKKSNLIFKKQIQKVNEIAEFLYQFNLYKLDEHKNLLVHWGLPILNDWSVVSVQVNEKMTEHWLDLLEKFNQGLKSLDLWLLTALVTWMSSEYQDYNILYDMKCNSLLKDPELMYSVLSKINTSSHFIPTRYLNDLYFSHEKIKKGLKEELQRHNINALIVWHCWNKIPDDWFCNIKSDYWTHLLKQKGTLIRLDRSFLKRRWNWWNFWYLIVSETGEYIEVWDSFTSLNI